MPNLDLPLLAQKLDTTCAATCFDSMFLYFKGHSHGEMYFAGLLQTLELGYTPPEHVASLARAYGWKSELKRKANLTDLMSSLEAGAVVFVTWWDEDAGHYSLISDIGTDYVILMDPWLARKGLRHQLPLASFLEYWAMRGNVMISVLK